MTGTGTTYTAQIPARIPMLPKQFEKATTQKEMEEQLEYLNSKEVMEWLNKDPQRLAAWNSAAVYQKLHELVVLLKTGKVTPQIIDVSKLGSLRGDNN